MAAHNMNVLRSVHNAHEKGLLSRETRDNYVLEFAHSMEKWPGIRPHYIAIYDSLGAAQGLAVYAPISEYIAAQPPAEME